MTEQELLVLKANLCNRFDAVRPGADKEAHVTDGSFPFAHNGVASAARQLERLARVNPRFIVEIGTGRGVGTLLLSGLAQRLLTIDIGPYPLRRAIWEWGGATNICQVLVDGDDSKEKLLAELNFQVALVDGDHSPQGCRLDMRACQKCGLLLFHDYVPPFDNGPLQVAHSLPEQEVLLDPPFFWWSSSPALLERLA